VEIVNALTRLLKDDYEVFGATSGLTALEITRREEIAVVLADQRMPQMTGVELFRQIRSENDSMMRILITAYADLDATVAAVNEANIFYYIAKPWEPEELQLIVRRAAEQYLLAKKNAELTRELLEANRLLTRENTVLKTSLPGSADFSSMIGHAPKMLGIFDLVRKVVDTPTTVLILGETGTGKEMLARAVHANSSRKDKIFVAQNCAALPDSLLESELFGHTRGAFTGAVQEHTGLFELADGGTIFLDEIGDTSPALQQRLLRVLQEGEIRRIGATHSVKVNVRVIAATNKSLPEEVRAGRFREDLYYRLNVFPVELPPLRERREDIADLVDLFIRRFSRRINKRINGISPAAIQRLQAARFPGNIRELENEIERAVTLTDDGERIELDDLSVRFRGGETEGEPVLLDPDLPLKDQVETLETDRIKSALRKTGGNILQAAKLLGLSRAGLHKKMNRYGITANNL
jgi:two-component system response regulator HupR/HoxA